MYAFVGLDADVGIGNGVDVGYDVGVALARTPAVEEQPMAVAIDTEMAMNAAESHFMA